jgi:hypothetical protein
MMGILLIKMSEVSQEDMTTHHRINGLLIARHVDAVLKLEGDTRRGGMQK